MPAERTKTAWPLTIFYDGSCPVCDREMAHYRQLHHGGRLRFIDISQRSFYAEHYQRSQAEFMARMHVMDANGRFAIGVEAFPKIWQALPGRRYRWCGRLLLLPGVLQLAKLGYRIFANNRHRLRRADCTEDGCSR